MLPGVVEPQRPLATVRLPGRGQPAICALRQEAAEGEAADEGGAAAGVAPAAGVDRETRLAVATAEGILLSYRLELPEEGGGSGGGGGGGALRCSLEGEWPLVSRR